MPDLAADLPQPGERESQTREFKHSDILVTIEGRRDLLREIVAMRNAAEGGEIFVGVSETDGAAADRMPLGDAAWTHLEALRDAAIDSIEPIPTVAIDPDGSTDADVALQRVLVPGGWILHIGVKPGPTGAHPSCLRRKRGREFLRRIDSRITVMPYHTIFSAGAGDTAIEPDEATIDRLRADWLREFEGLPGLSLVLVPLPRPADSTLPEVPHAWHALLRSPSPQLARPQGWSWHTTAQEEPRVRRGEIHAGIRDEERQVAYRRLRIDGTGCLRFFTDLESLTWKPQEAPKASEHFPHHRGQIAPLSLVETVASTLRLAAHILATLPTTNRPDRIATRLSLHGVRAFLLPLGTPGTIAFFIGDRANWVHFVTEEVPSRTLIRPSSDLLTPPGADRLSLRLLEDIYESDPATAELRPGAIPWFDADQHFQPPS